MGRLIISVGILLVIVGLVVMLGERAGVRFGRLPGDIRLEGKHGGFYFPVVTCVVTCIVISIVISVISWFLRSR